MFVNNKISFSRNSQLDFFFHGIFSHNHHHHRNHKLESHEKWDLREMLILCTFFDDSGDFNENCFWLSNVDIWIEFHSRRIEICEKFDDRHIRNQICRIWNLLEWNSIFVSIKSSSFSRWFVNLRLGLVYSRIRITKALKFSWKTLNYALQFQSELWKKSFRFSLKARRLWIMHKTHYCEEARMYQTNNMEKIIFNKFHSSLLVSRWIRTRNDLKYSRARMIFISQCSRHIILVCFVVQTPTLWISFPVFYY